MTHRLIEDIAEQIHNVDALHDGLETWEIVTLYPESFEMTIELAHTAARKAVEAVLDDLMAGAEHLQRKALEAGNEGMSDQWDSVGLWLAMRKDEVLA